MKSRKIVSKWSFSRDQLYDEQLYYENREFAINEFAKHVDEEILSTLFDIARVTINGKTYILNSHRGIVDNSDNLEYINIICELNKKL